MAALVDLNGNRWNLTDHNALLQAVKREVVAELCARDVALGVPKSGQVCRIETGPGGSQQYVVDEKLSRLKHSGAETNQKLKRRFEELISKPLDPKTELARWGLEAEPMDTGSGSGVSRNDLDGLRSEMMGAMKAMAESISSAVAGNGQAFKKRGKTKEETVDVKA